MHDKVNVKLFIAIDYSPTSTSRIVYIALLTFPKSKIKL